MPCSGSSSIISKLRGGHIIKANDREGQSTLLILKKMERRKDIDQPKKDKMKKSRTSLWLGVHLFLLKNIFYKKISFICINVKNFYIIYIPYY